MVLGVLTKGEKFSHGWYDGCQATVWALEMIVEIHSPYMALSELEQARKRPIRIQKLLAPGNFINLFYLQTQGLNTYGRRHTKTIKYCPLSSATFVLKLIFFGYSGSSTCCNLDLKLSPSSVAFSR